MFIVSTYTYSHDAHLDLAKLLDEGIECELMDDNLVSIAPHYSNAVGGIKLVVWREEDLVTGRKILGMDNSQILSEEFGEDAISLERCPQCNSIDVSTKRSIISGILFLFLFFLPVATKTQNLFCNKCGYVWRPRK